MPPRNIRPIAICVFRHNGRILVTRCQDPDKPRPHYRPLGGGIEYGERSEQAVQREIREELGADIERLVHLATLENIFQVSGDTRHEIVFVYDAEFVDRSFYACTEIAYVDEPGQTARWMPLDAFAPGGEHLVPDGLLSWLMAES